MSDRILTSEQYDLIVAAVGVAGVVSEPGRMDGPLTIRTADPVTLGSELGIAIVNHMEKGYPPDGDFLADVVVKAHRRASQPFIGSADWLIFWENIYVARAQEDHDG